jgi:hypothetical protein
MTVALQKRRLISMGLPFAAHRQFGKQLQRFAAGKYDFEVKSSLLFKYFSAVSNRLMNPGEYRGVLYSY